MGMWQRFQGSSLCRYYCIFYCTTASCKSSIVENLVQNPPPFFFWKSNSKYITQHIYSLLSYQHSVCWHVVTSVHTTTSTESVYVNGFVYTYGILSHHISHQRSNELRQIKSQMWVLYVNALKMPWHIRLRSINSFLTSEPESFILCLLLWQMYYSTQMHFPFNSSYAPPQALSTYSRYENTSRKYKARIPNTTLRRNNLPSYLVGP